MTIPFCRDKLTGFQADLDQEWFVETPVHNHGHVVLLSKKKISVGTQKEISDMLSEQNK